MKWAMWKVAPSGNFTFRDRFVGEEIIFGIELDTSPLQRELSCHFAGETVPIETIIQPTCRHRDAVHQ